MTKIDIKTMKVQSEDDLIALLPPLLVQMSNVIGLSNTLLVIDKFGGLSFAMPTTADSENAKRLMAVIGAEAASALIQHYGGEQVYINNCTNLRILLRNQAFMDAVLATMETGVSQYRAIQETAPEFGITERRAYDILKEMTDKKAQLNLF